MALTSGTVAHVGRCLHYDRQILSRLQSLKSNVARDVCGNPQLAMIISCSIDLLASALIRGILKEQFKKKRFLLFGVKIRSQESICSGEHIGVVDLCLSFGTSPSLYTQSCLSNFF